MLEYSRTLLRNTIHGYTTVHVNAPRVITDRIHWDYTLMPIWILTYHRKNKRHTYALNGYTGKVYGRLPVSGKRLSILGVVVGALVGIAAGVITALAM